MPIITKKISGILSFIILMVLLANFAYAYDDYAANDVMVTEVEAQYEAKDLFGDFESKILFQKVAMSIESYWLVLYYKMIGIDKGAFLHKSVTIGLAFYLLWFFWGLIFSFERDPRQVAINFICVVIATTLAQNPDWVFKLIFVNILGTTLKVCSFFASLGGSTNLPDLFEYLDNHIVGVFELATSWWPEDADLSAMAMQKILLVALLVILFGIPIMSYFIGLIMSYAGVAMIGLLAPVVVLSLVSEYTRGVASSLCKGVAYFCTLMVVSTAILSLLIYVVGDALSSLHQIENTDAIISSDYIYAVFSLGVLAALSSLPPFIVSLLITSRGASIASGATRAAIGAVAATSLIGNKYGRRPIASQLRKTFAGQNASTAYSEQFSPPNTDKVRGKSSTSDTNELPSDND